MTRHLGAIILNAGASRRMGRPKWSLRYNERESFLDRARDLARAAIGDGQIVVVGSAGSEELPGPTHVVNPNPELGMFSSVRLGVSALLDLDTVGGCLLLLIDHPLVKKKTVVHLADRFWLDPVHPVVPSYAGQSGHPIILDRETLQQANAAAQDCRLDQLISSPTLVPVDDPGVVRNINTPSRYEEFFGPM